jgi:hypothetical protein
MMRLSRHEGHTGGCNVLLLVLELFLSNAKNQRPVGLVHLPRRRRDEDRIHYPQHLILPVKMATPRTGGVGLSNG